MTSVASLPKYEETCLHFQSLSQGCRLWKRLQERGTVQHHHSVSKDRERERERERESNGEVGEKWLTGEV